MEIAGLRQELSGLEAEAIALRAAAGDLPRPQGVAAAASSAFGLDQPLPGRVAGRVKLGLNLLAEHEQAGGHPGSSIFEETDDELDEEEGWAMRPLSARRARLDGLDHSCSRDMSCLRKCLYVLSNGDADRAAHLHVRFSSDSHMQNVTGDSIGDSVVESAASFLQSPICTSAGTRPAAVQAAMSILLMVIVPVAVSAKRLVTSFAQRLFNKVTTASRGLVKYGSELRQKLEETGKVPSLDRRVRYDRRDVGWVKDMSHIAGIGRLDTFSRKRVKVEYPDGSFEYHDQHVLECGTKEKAAELILKSPQYLEWQAHHHRRDGRELSMSKKFIAANLCPCLTEPSFRECADMVVTQQREFVSGFDRVRQHARSERQICECAACAYRRKCEAVGVSRTTAMKMKVDPSSEMVIGFAETVSTALGRDVSGDLSVVELATFWAEASACSTRRAEAVRVAREVASSLKYEEEKKDVAASEAAASLRALPGSDALKAAASRATRAAKRKCELKDFLLALSARLGRDSIRSKDVIIEDLEAVWRAAVPSSRSADEDQKNLAGKKIAGFFTSKLGLARSADFADPFSRASKSPALFADYFLCSREKCHDLFVDGVHTPTPKFRKRPCCTS